MSNYTEFGIFMSLLDGKLHKASDLAQKFEVSTKTIYRQANKLACSGFPITTQAGKNGGITFAGKYKCDTWFFSESELAYVLNLVNSNKNINPVLSSIISSKIQEHVQGKELFDVPRQAEKFFVDNNCWFQTNTTNLSEYSHILDACVNCKQLEILYSQNDYVRTIDPYCIVYKENNYYLYAFCNTKQQFRLFKICRIEKLTYTDNTFIKQNVDLTTKPWNNSKFDYVDILATCKTDVITDVSTWAKVEKLNNETYKIRAVNNDGLINKLLEYGNRIKIIKPTSIAQNLLEKCKNILNIYSLT